MTDREKLVGLVKEICNTVVKACGCSDMLPTYSFCKNAMYESFADYLITNGVTVRKWISVKDELPKSEVLAANFSPGTHGYKEYIIGFVSGERCTESGGCVAENDYEILNDVTHWMPLPEPLKEETL